MEPLRPSPNRLGYYSEDGGTICYACIRHRGECEDVNRARVCFQGIREVERRRAAGLLSPNTSKEGRSKPHRWTCSTEEITDSPRRLGAPRTDAWRSCQRRSSERGCLPHLQARPVRDRSWEVRRRLDGHRCVILVARAASPRRGVDTPALGGWLSIPMDRSSTRKRTAGRD